MNTHSVLYASWIDEFDGVENRASGKAIGESSRKAVGTSQRKPVANVSLSELYEN
jgi:hypothetical protein